MFMSRKRSSQSGQSGSSTDSSGSTSASAAQQSGGSGNAHMQERLGLQGDQSSSEGSAEKTAQVILSARKGGSPFSQEFWTELDVGHCWVDVVTPEGRKESWGYTVQSFRDFPRYQPWKSVPGEVLHPDGSRGASGTLKRDITADQLQQGEDWGNAAGEVYNLFGLNGGHSCATFAKGFFEAATGERAPTSMFGALIASPNDLSAAMNEQAAKDAAQDPGAARGDEQSSN